MALSEETTNKLKVLIYEDKKDEAEAVIMKEVGLSKTEANLYIERLQATIKGPAKENSKPKSSKMAAYVIMGIGFLMWGLAVFFFMKKQQQLDNSYLASGVVVDFVINEGFAPVISYEIEGAPYQYISSIYSTPPAFDLNETVKIYVDKNDPNNIIINSFVNKWLMVTIFASFGLVLNLIGLVVMKLKSTGQTSTVEFFDNSDERMSAFDD
jgi:hypothetical protein